jgi:protein TonB
LGEPLVPPRPVAGLDDNRQPDYPESARSRGEQGRVLLRVEVSTHGRPLAVTVAQSSGYALLDDAATAAVRRWRFVAATRGGSPVVAAAEVPIRFALVND